MVQLLPILSIVKSREKWCNSFIGCDHLRHTGLKICQRKHSLSTDVMCIVYFKTRTIIIHLLELETSFIRIVEDVLWENSCWKRSFPTLLPLPRIPISCFLLKTTEAGVVIQNYAYCNPRNIANWVGDDWIAMQIIEFYISTFGITFPVQWNVTRFHRNNVFLAFIAFYMHWEKKIWLKSQVSNLEKSNTLRFLLRY
jgi:hypothetical protein